MVYHSDVTDFAQDFLRTQFWWLYDVSDYGASFAASPSQAIDEAIAKGLTNSDQLIADFLEENPSISHLLDRGRAEKWAAADASTVERAINAAAGLVADVSVKRVSNAGWIVGTHVYNDLQEFYLALAMLLDDETARARR